MRIYNNCVSMLDETYREIWKRGQTIFDKTVQGKKVSETDFEQKEIIFYSYRVDNFDDLKQMLDKARETFGKEHMQFAVAEAWFKDMISNKTLKEEWWNKTEYTRQYFNQFCNEGNGLASYSYGERIIPQLNGVIKRMKDNIFARGAIIVIPIPDDINRLGRRVPCTVSYHFIARPTITGVKLNLIVYQRSADAINFFPLDFAKAVLFLQYISKELGVDPGYIIHSIDSLHVYTKDVTDEYKW